MRRIPLLYQILIVNSAIVCLGATAGTWTTRQLSQTGSGQLTITFAFIGLVLSVGVNYALLRYALRPLTDLQATAERVTAGDLSVRAPTPRSGDPTIAQLSVAFNTMLDQVEDDTRAIERSRELTERLTQQVIDAQEEERRRIARELHDDTAQALATLVLYAQTAGAAPAAPPQVVGRLEELGGLASRTLAGVRTIIADLRPSQLDDLGLAAAIRAQAQERLEPLGIRVDVQVRGEERRLPATVEIALYRVMQEAFTNIIKHAQASYVEVDLNLSQPNVVRARVEDDGVGFDLRSVRPGLDGGRGVGLFGMHERISLLGGALSMDSTPGVGTEIHIDIPLQQRPPPAPAGAAGEPL
ncbi:MAG TPA: ATP-binding protein [Herpetosiphonaceae bacterium]